MSTATGGARRKRRTTKRKPVRRKTTRKKPSKRKPARRTVKKKTGLQGKTVEQLRVMAKKKGIPQSRIIKGERKKLTKQQLINRLRK